MKITTSEPGDIEEIFRLYACATAFQKEKFPGNQWPTFSRELVEKEILENRQFKLLIRGEIACIWAITLSDPEIWGERNEDPAVYIHRIATNPAYRGRNFVSAIVEWAKEYAAHNNKPFIRLDTCGNNEKLINHYGRNGFRFLGMEKLSTFGNLPAHYQNADVCYFEIKLQ